MHIFPIPLHSTLNLKMFPLNYMAEILHAEFYTHG